MRHPIRGHAESVEPKYGTAEVLVAIAMMRLVENIADKSAEINKMNV